MVKKSIIISEIGINANGDIDIAKKLILASKFAGVDLVKFQKRNIEKVYTKTELDKPRESPWGKTNREQKERLEFNEAQYDEIDRFCKQEAKIPWFASCWDLDSVEFIKKYDTPYNKIASALLTHKKLLEAIAKQGKHTFISTGMSTIEEIDATINIFKKEGCDFSLMHCNSQYPMPDDERANLLCIKSLRKYFNCNVGYSSHSVGIIDCVAAAALGATSIEKHITLDRAMYGSDQASSVEPSGFHRMVEYIRLVENYMGDGIKRVTKEEEIVKAKLRREGDIEYN